MDFATCQTETKTKENIFHRPQGTGAPALALALALALASIDKRDPDPQAHQDWH